MEQKIGDVAKRIEVLAHVNGRLEEARKDFALGKHVAVLAVLKNIKDENVSKNEIDDLHKKSVRGVVEKMANLSTGKPNDSLETS